jgi:hypothetical protein
MSAAHVLLKLIGFDANQLTATAASECHGRHAVPRSLVLLGWRFGSHVLDILQGASIHSAEEASAASDGGHAVIETGQVSHPRLGGWRGRALSLTIVNQL